MRYRFFFILSVLLASSFVCADDLATSSVPQATPDPVLLPDSVQLAAFTAPSASFREIWGYLQSGEENLLDSSWPVTDIGYFSAGLNYRGKLVGVPDRKKLASYTGRVHLVIAEVTNQALTHFCLDPAFAIRDELITSIADAAAPYDGVQIDFELIPASDDAYFYSFLTDLKKKIGAKTLSVAIPARTRKITDAFDYATISRIVDRVIVMAYDEHWSGSTPGSIASLEWCRKVSAYALSIIGTEKLVMGLPFYGRAWADTSLSKAYRFSGISRLLGEKNIAEINREDSVPSFTYQETVNVRVFYEDVHSLINRALLYREASVQSVAFWKIGQEDSSIWAQLSIAQ